MGVNVVYFSSLYSFFVFVSQILIMKKKKGNGATECKPAFAVPACLYMYMVIEQNLMLESNYMKKPKKCRE